MDSVLLAHPTLRNFSTHLGGVAHPSSEGGVADAWSDDSGIGAGCRYAKDGGKDCS